MNAKEAREILIKSKTPGSIFLCEDPRKFDLDELVAKANSFLEATKAAEPLLVVIEELRNAMEIHEVEYATVTGKQALSSSAQVVEKYKKEVLGGIMEIILSCKEGYHHKACDCREEVFKRLLEYGKDIDSILKKVIAGQQITPMLFSEVAIASGRFLHVAMKAEEILK